MRQPPRSTSIIYLHTLATLATLLLWGCKASEPTEPDPSYEVILTTDKATIVADGIDVARLSATCNGAPAQDACELFVAHPEGKLSSHSFSTDRPGTYELYAVYLGRYRSNTIRIEAHTLAISLRASADRLVADGVQEVRLEVLHEGQDVTSQSQLYRLVGEELIPMGSSTFRTREAGSYTFVAQYRGARSSSLVLEATEPEHPIELHASALELVADGTSTISFAIARVGHDVTSRGEIWYAREGEQVLTRLTGTTFATREAGRYTFEARYGQTVSPRVQIQAREPHREDKQPQGPGTLFVRGVSKEYGWYDVNKKKDGRGIDGLRCWAASCANALQWWQDTYRRAGYSLPAGVPDGAGTRWELKIFEEFVDNWSHLGASSYIGFRWYFTGQNDAAHYSGFAQPKLGSGAYLRTVYDQIREQWGDDYAITIGGYSTWDTGSGRTEDALKIFSDLIIPALREGIVILDINPGFSSSHAVTLWGCEYDAEGIVRYVYITDSDDLIHKPKAPRTPILHRLEVARSTRSPRTIGLKGTTYKPFVEIQNFDTLRAFPRS